MALKPAVIDGASSPLSTFGGVWFLRSPGGDLGGPGKRVGRTCPYQVISIPAAQRAASTFGDRVGAFAGVIRTRGAGTPATRTETGSLPEAAVIRHSATASLTRLMGAAVSADMPPSMET